MTEFIGKVVEMDIKTGPIILVKVQGFPIYHAGLYFKEIIYSIHINTAIHWWYKTPIELNSYRYIPVTKGDYYNLTI